MPKPELNAESALHNPLVPEALAKSAPEPTGLLQARVGSNTNNTL